MRTTSVWGAVAIGAVGAMVGCSSTSTASDGGAAEGGAGVASDGATVPPGPGTGPAVPTAGPGEIAIVVRDGSTDTELRCQGTDPANPTRFHGTIGQGSPGTESLVLGCTHGSSAQEQKSVVIQVTGPTFTPGTTAVTAGGANQLRIVVVRGGEGVSLQGAAYTGSLVLTEVGPKGGAVRGSFTASWERIGKVTGGTVGAIEARPGSIAVAFQFTRP